MLIAICGDLDMATTPQVTAYLAEHTATRPQHVILDLTEVEFLAAHGVQLLLTAQDNAQAGGGRLHLVGASTNRRVHYPLTVLGLTDHFDLAPDLATLLGNLDT